LSDTLTLWVENVHSVIAFSDPASAGPNVAGHIRSDDAGNTQSQGGFADGIRADVAGNIWASAGWVGEGYDGVHIFNPQGKRIGQILLPEICANVCFGGTKRNQLFMCGSTSLYSVYVGTRGAHFC
jgi:sugar lactone lactonase YvrE